MKENTPSAYDLYQWSVSCERFASSLRFQVAELRKEGWEGSHSGYHEFMVEAPLVLHELLRQLGYNQDPLTDLQQVSQLALNQGKTSVPSGSVLPAWRVELPTWELVLQLSHRAQIAEQRLEEAERRLRELAAPPGPRPTS